MKTNRSSHPERDINKAERLRRKKSERNFNLVLTGLFSAIIIVMTVIPYTGYISYGAVFEITTLHIVVILGACVLGPAKGAVLGGVWGVTCLFRALTNPLWIAFVNPLVSVLPRILVGVVAGGIYYLLTKDRKNTAFSVVSLIISTVAGTLTNTLLVLTMYSLFAGTLNNFMAIYELLKNVLLTLIAVNGLVELGIAVVLVPLIFTVISREIARRGRRTNTIGQQTGA